MSKGSNQVLEYRRKAQIFRILEHDEQLEDSHSSAATSVVLTRAVLFKGDLCALSGFDACTWVRQGARWLQLRFVDRSQSAPNMVMTSPIGPLSQISQAPSLMALEQGKTEVLVRWLQYVLGTFFGRLHGEGEGQRQRERERDPSSWQLSICCVGGLVADWSEHTAAAE